MIRSKENCRIIAILILVKIKIPIMKLLNSFLTLALLFISFSSFAQKWHQIFDPVQDQSFLLVDENEDGNIAVLTKVSTTDHTFTILNQEGDVLNEIDFQLPSGPFRFYHYEVVGPGEYAVLCRSIFVNSDDVRIIKFDQAGQSTWVKDLSNANYKVRPHALSVLDNGNIAAMGIAELFSNSNNNQELFLYELDSDDGSVVHHFFVDTPLQYSTGIKLVELSNGNYLCLEAEMPSNQINAFGGMNLRQFYLNEITKAGGLIKSVSMASAIGSDPFESRLHILAPDSVFLITHREAFLLNEDLDIIWRSRTDLTIEDIVFDTEDKTIAMIGQSFTNLDYEGVSFLLMDFAGEILHSKSYGTATRINSSADEYGIDRSAEGYILASVRKSVGSDDHYLECLRTDAMGAVDEYNVFDVYAACSDYALTTPEFNPPVNDCGEVPDVTTYKVNSSTELNCVFGTLSKRLQSIVHVMTDSCGNLDSVIQVIHYEAMAPAITCCDFTILSQDADGATIQLAPVTVDIDGNCTSYELFHLDDFDLNEPTYFETGMHTINFLLENSDCNRMDSLYQSFDIEIVFIDEDGDGFEASVDCDDTNENVNPDADEIPYNGIDDDCDETTLDDDLDQDGFVLADDCDDMNAMINPDVEEIVYNGIDDDCDEATLDDDLDQDGFVLADDCDDMNAEINPDVEEIVYNGIDDDCDEATLDDDLDQDGFVLADDCDDMNAAINPSVEEIVYNGVDDDCDETTLDDDLDQDGFVLELDCDDLDSLIYPGAMEIPNNDVDEDCDGEDLVLSTYEIGNAKIDIFPNPATEFIFIEVEGQLDYIISLIDMSGKRIMSGSNLTTIDLTNVVKGAYLLSIEDNDSRKIIVENVIVLK